MNGFTFDGIHVSTVSGYNATLSYEKEGMPEFENYMTDIKRRNGQVDGGKKKKGREFKASFSIDASNQLDLYQKIDSINEWLDTPDMRVLSFDAFPYVSYKARLKNAPQPKIIGLSATYELTFFSTDAHGTGNAKSFTTVNFQQFTRTGNEETMPIFDVNFTAVAAAIDLVLYQATKNIAPHFGSGRWTPALVANGTILTNDSFRMVTTSTDWTNKQWQQYVDIPARPNTKYTIQGLFAGRVCVNSMDAANTSLATSFDQTAATEALKSQTITTPANTVSLRLYLVPTGAGTFTFKNMQIEEAATVTPFVSYQLVRMKNFKVTKSFAINDKMNIDMALRKVTHNSADARKFVDMASRYFTLPKYYAFGIQNGVTLTHSYTERWK
ncbi:putative tail protein [Bacillus phage vB_BceS-M2]